MTNRLFKFVVSISAFLYVVLYTTTKLDWHFIDNVDLIIHEAGHVVFAPFGYLLQIAGGSLFQILIPIIFIIYFISNKKYYSVSAIGYWLAINFVNVSVYAGDALKMQLPLLTGDTDGHDWNQILFYLGQLRHTYIIASIIFIIGILIAIASLILSFAAYKGMIQEDNEGVYVQE